jgi:GSH-dependent disulfide-bond oxidoreductase
MIDLYFWPTPNATKVTILLEETGLPYRIIPLNIGRGDQFDAKFLKINPNHRMPAMVDTEPKGGGAPISVFESGAIMMYLADKAGRFWPQDVAGKYEVVQWVVWQIANQGPKFGESAHFRRLGPKDGDQSYALRRYSDEVNRIFGVLNYRLYDRRYLAGDDYTIADMISYPFTASYAAFGEDIDNFKHVKRWLEELSERPAVKRGMAVGADLTAHLAKLSPEEKAARAKILYNQRAIPAPDESYA